MRSEHWQQRLALFREELSTFPKNGIIFLGDSITEEFSLSHYFPGLPLINRGVSGDTIDGVIERMETSVSRLIPSKLFIMIGVNDVGSDMGQSYVQSQYTYLLSLVQNTLPQSKLYVQSVLPCSVEWGGSMPGQIKKINQSLQNICRKNDILFINLYDVFIDPSGYLKKNLTRDGLHLNKNGYDLWAKQVGKYILPETNND